MFGFFALKMKKIPPDVIVLVCLSLFSIINTDTQCMSLVNMLCSVHFPRTELEPPFIVSLLRFCLCRRWQTALSQCQTQTHSEPVSTHMMVQECHQAACFSLSHRLGVWQPQAPAAGPDLTHRRLMDLPVLYSVSLTAVGLLVFHLKWGKD